MDELRQQILEKIKCGEDLSNKLTQYQIDGIPKLYRKIKQELNFLRKVYRTNTIKKEQIQCTHLTHFSALLVKLRTVADCVSVNKTFALNDRKLIVDIVCGGGLSWIKVIARNPKSLSQICMGNGSYGARSIVDQADEFVECASTHPTLFQTPKITFVFPNGIGKRLANKLESLGIVVEGDRIDLYEEIDCDDWSTSELSTRNTSDITKVNLDISTMLVYCSSITNGACDKFEFSDPGLVEQIHCERLGPVKPILDKLFEGKTLYCCETARESFINILNIIGGPNERNRGLKLLERVTVLPDDATISSTVSTEASSDIFSKVQYSGDKLLEAGGKIKEKSLKIFAFGDRIQAITVTSNDRFVRTTRQKGVHFVVFVHESRALTEQQETKATLTK